MTKFIPGLKLNRLFYQREVRPILAKEFSSLRYSAALIGWGSEVLGFDTALSRDHHWGPRVLLFLRDLDSPRFSERITQQLSLNLPYKFMAYSTNFSEPEPNGVRHLVETYEGPVNHMVQIFTTRSFVKARLGFDPAEEITTTDWLTFPQQRLLELTSGEVYYDGLRELRKLRRKFSYYPKDIWLYMLAAQWKRISQEEAFLGRAGHVDDELGSKVVAARIVREIMRLSFVMERRYIPYSKWMGSAFNKLKVAKRLKPILHQVLLSRNWQEREKAMSEAYSIVARAHNALNITEHLPTKVSNYFNRPYLVIHADGFSEAIRQSIRSAEVKKIKTEIGSIDQFSDSTSVVEDLQLQRRLRVAYEQSPSLKIPPA
jgi:hypothetical protein